MVMENHFNAASLFATLGIDDRETAATFFAWLLCWHDIGKFARLFQQQYRCARDRAASAMLTTAAITTPSPARGCGKTILVIAWRRA
ncbi:CRISPR-associated helicase Cas3, protein [Cronobacter sakazakii 701]|nr:CRISPR-associated helicase Cas3, protein [Cronobacter sakazakii 701]